MRALAGPLLVVVVSGLGACKSKLKCSDAAVDKAFTGIDAATAEALTHAKESSKARMCDEVLQTEGGREPGALVFTGSMPTAWKAIEDALATAGWARYQQDKTPAPDTTLFQVLYKKKGREKKWEGPTFFLMLTWNHSGTEGCRFGEVCATGHVN